MEISHSRIKTWRKCHQLHYYRYVERLQRRRPLLPLIRGRVIGEMMDAAWSQQPIQAVVDKYQEDFGRLFAQERDYYGNLLEDCTQIVSGYIRHYVMDDPDEQPYRVVATEEKLELDLLPDIKFTGYIDKHLEDADGNEWVLDHKSHKSLPDEDTRFADLQLLFYCWAGAASGKYRKTPGIIWDYLRTKLPSVPELLKDGKGLSKRANIDSTPAAYRQAILENGFRVRDYREILESLRGNVVKFYRRVVLPPPSKVMIDNAVRDMKTTALEILTMGEVNRTRSMSRDCKSCEFFGLCQSEVRGLDTAYMRAKEYEPRKGDDRGQGGEEDEVND